MRRWIPSAAVFALAAGGLSALSGSNFSLQAQQQSASTVSQPPQLEFVEQYCISCHDNLEKKGELSLEMVPADVAQQPEIWEKVVRKLRARQMPPVGAKGTPGRSDLRPDGAPPRDVARSRGGRASQSGPHGHHPATDANGVPQCRARSPGPRCRRRRAAAARRLELWLRQRDGR